MPMEMELPIDRPVDAADVARHYGLSNDSELIDPLLTMAGYTDEMIAGEVIAMETEIAEQKAEIANLRRIAEIELYATTNHSPINAITANLADMKAASVALINDMRDLSPRDLYTRIEAVAGLMHDNCDDTAQKLHNYAHAVKGGQK